VIKDVIGTRRARFWQPGVRIGREQIEDLLSTVAAWHRALRDSAWLARWPWLKTPLEQMRVIDALIGLADRTRAGTERARGVIPLAVQAHQAELLDAMRRSMETVSAGPRTYLHGDLHIADAYLMPANRVGIADWQVGLQGSWAHDFAYMVMTALEVEDRRAWERGLLDFYLERLAGAGGRAPPRGRAWQAYRQATFYPYFAWLYTIGRSRLQPNFQPGEVSLTMIGRIASAIEDLEAFAAVGL
jgi:hypothetical protein